jgi:BirA family biotin operon repressor/biotin-[acetyl-CoA-carboxylase] ligase
VPKKQTIGEPFVELDAVESTNTLAMRAASSRSALPGTVWFAHGQTAGKGQRGRVWHSEPGTSLAMSILLEAPFSDPSSGFPLSAATALACLDALGETGVGDLTVKWPNDLYHGDRKLGGILIENLVRGADWTHAVVGIGINVNQSRFDPSLPNPVSLLQAIGREQSPVVLARTLCGKLESRLEDLKSKGVDATLEAFNERLHGKGRCLSYRRNGRAFVATPVEVMRDGTLLLSCPPPNRFRHGELEWLPSNDDRAKGRDSAS